MRDKQKWRPRKRQNKELKQQHKKVQKNYKNSEEGRDAFSFGLSVAVRVKEETNFSISRQVW